MTKRSASAIDADAARYVARMDADAWSDESESELETWLALDPKHPGALLRAQAAWMTLDPPRSSASSLRRPTRPSTRLSRRSMLAAGGAAMAASIAGGIMLFDGTTYATEIGEIRRIPLADGSIAAINTASAIAVNLTTEARYVQIDRGEAWFQVAKDKRRPFIVAAGRARVRAVGTAFSVRRREGGADILVTEGEVEVWADGAEGHRLKLKTGVRGFIADNAAIELASADPSAIDRTLAWRGGKIDLTGDTLGSAAAEFNRYNQRQLVIADPVIAAERLDGIFRTDDPEGFAQAVKRSLEAQMDISDPARIRIGRPNH